ncbi:peptidoglycan binding domain-containing protein [Secundilactobacillus collinoides]|uniref:peptidoglycan binding domain-containing protein n=1 Tax=Secundilactobacillus collinoides TaxID=33960 RepID=UPI0006CFDA57|nr:peptidoglycan binding domain-containing protein [Secundilactobacillus collinoides]
MGGQTAGAAAETINVKLSHQVYTVTDQSKILTTFTAKEIGITPYTANQIKQLISNQNAYAWPAHMTRASANSHRLGLKAINKAKLSAVSNRVVRLANNAKRTPTRNAKLVYNNQSFVIKRQVYGQQVNRDSVKQSVTNAVANHQSQIDLKTAYIKPTILQSNASLKKSQTNSYQT